MQEGKINWQVMKSGKKEVTLNVALFSFLLERIQVLHSVLLQCVTSFATDQVFSGKFSVLLILFLLFPQCLKYQLHVCATASPPVLAQLRAACVGQVDAWGKGLLSALQARCSAGPCKGLPCLMDSNQARAHWKHFQTMIIIFKVQIAVQVVKTLIVSVEGDQGRQQAANVTGAFEGRDLKPARCQLVCTQVCCVQMGGGILTNSLVQPELQHGALLGVSQELKQQLPGGCSGESSFEKAVVNERGLKKDLK